MNKEETFPPNWSYQITVYSDPSYRELGRAKIYAANGDAVWEGLYLNTSELEKTAWSMFGVSKECWLELNKRDKGK